MTTLTIIQILISLVILNVWLLRFNRATAFRGGNATNMSQEFAVYGLPAWSVPVVGFFKVLFAILLIVGVWVPSLTQPAAIGLGAFMLGAVVMHVKVRDSLVKTAPSLAMLALCGVLAQAL